MTNGEFPFPDMGEGFNQSYWCIPDFPPALSVTIGRSSWKLLEAIFRLLYALSVASPPFPLKGVYRLVVWTLFVVETRQQAKVGFQVLIYVVGMLFKDERV